MSMTDRDQAASAVEWIADPHALETLCRALEEAPVLALDTESDQFHAYRPRVCLIQVADRSRVALIDALRFDAGSIAPLRRLLEAPGPVKVVHAVRNDLLALQRDLDIHPRNLFDTYEAVRFLGYARHGLDALLAEHASVHVSKRHQRFNWRTRPLPAPVAEYAASDVRYLVQLRQTLREELAAAGWLEAHAEHCAWLERNTVYEAGPEFDPEGWRKVRGADELAPHAQNVLRELYLWRHEACSATNTATLFLADDLALVRLAREQPATHEALRQLRGLSSSTATRHGDAILECISRARRHQPPPPPRRPRARPASGPRPTRHQVAVFEALREWRNDVAEYLGLPGDLVASNGLLKAISLAEPETARDLSRIAELQPWQARHFGAGILELVRLMRASR